MQCSRRLPSALAITFSSSSNLRTATVTPSSNSTGVIYTWDWGDGTITTSTEVPSSHSYTYVGTYMVQANAVDSWGNVATVVTNPVTVRLPIAAPYYDPANEVGGGYTFGTDLAGDMYAINAAALKAMLAINSYGSLGQLVFEDRDYLTAENAVAANGYGDFNTHINNITPGFNWTMPLIVEGGESTGATFHLARLPNMHTGVNLFLWIHLGTGYIAGTSPSRDWSWTQAHWDSIILWTHGYVIRNLNFDVSLLSDSDLNTLSPAGAGTGGVINMTGVGSQDQSIERAAAIENIHITKAFGTMGLVSCHGRSNQILVRDCSVDKAILRGFWFDSPRVITADGLTVSDRYAALSPIDVAGINFAINTDYSCHGDSIVARHLSVSDVQTAITLTGRNLSLTDSTVILPASSTTNSLGVSVNGGSDVSHGGVYATQNVSALRNRIYRDPAAATDHHYAFHVEGATSAAGEALTTGVDIERNTIGNSTRKINVGMDVGAHSDANIFRNNDLTISAVGVVANSANGDDITSPNTVH